MFRRCTLRDILGVVTIACALAGWWVDHRAMHAEIDELERLKAELLKPRLILSLRSKPSLTVPPKRSLHLTVPAELSLRRRSHSL